LQHLVMGGGKPPGEEEWGSRLLLKTEEKKKAKRNSGEKKGENFLKLGYKSTCYKRGKRDDGLFSCKVRASAKRGRDALYPRKSNQRSYHIGNRQVKECSMPRKAREGSRVAE